MVSFQKMYEAVATIPLSDEDGGAVSLYMKYEPSFWSTLAEISNRHPEGLAHLLGVKTTTEWYNKIKAISQKAEKLKSEKIRNKMLPTGDK